MMESKLSNIYWIHCNQCFEMYSFYKSKFYLMSCFHVICANCVNKALVDDKKMCPICKRNVGSKAISDDMQEKYLRYFHDKPWSDLNLLKDVVPFQMRQRDNFQKAIQKAEVEKQNVGENIRKLKQEFVFLYEKRDKLKVLRAKLEDQIHRYKVQNLTM